VAAEGSGQVLSAVSGRAEGLRLTVTGGELGERGTVDVSEGIGVSLASLLSNYLGDDGVVQSRTDGLQNIIDRIEDDRERLDTRLEAIEARIRNEFNGLDSLLATLQSTSQFLETQLANIPIPGVERNRR
jgi:flagellar hook-associated protein 2